MKKRVVVLWVMALACAAAPSLAVDAAPHYRMSLEVDAAAGSFRGDLVVRYTNDSGVDQTEVFFRLYGNAQALYASAFIDVLSAAVDGQAASYSLFADDTVLLVSLPEPVAPGESRDIELSFLGEAAHMLASEFEGGTEYGLLTRSDEVLTLTAFYPLLAPYTDEGWAIDPVASLGDALFAEAATYEVTLLVAKGVTVIPVPDSVEDDGEGRTRCSFARAALRDFSLVLVDGERTPQIVTTSGVAIRSWFPLRHASASSIALERGAAALDLYSTLFGPLPYATIDIVEVPLQRVAGVECSGLFLVSSAYASTPTDLFFDVIISHEMAHEWFYAAVGNDPVEEPWLDEALATFASNVFLTIAVSEGAAASERTQWATQYERAAQSAPDLCVTSSLYAFPDESTYSAFVYAGGALELDRLRLELGDEVFFRGLSDYYNRRAGTIAVGTDLLESFRHACDCLPANPLFGTAMASPL